MSDLPAPSDVVTEALKGRSALRDVIKRYTSTGKEADRLTMRVYRYLEGNPGGEKIKEYLLKHSSGYRLNAAARLVTTAIDGEESSIIDLMAEGGVPIVSLSSGCKNTGSVSTIPVDGPGKSHKFLYAMNECPCTSTCPCCTAEMKAVMTQSQNAMDHPFISDEVGKQLDRPPVVAHMCRVCGYRWQTLHYPGSRDMVVVHNLPSPIPGQPIPGQPACLDSPHGILATRKASEPEDDCFRVRVEQHGLVKEQIPTRQFEEELDRRQNARRAAICN